MASTTKKKSVPEKDGVPAKKDSTESILKWISALVALGGLIWAATSFLITIRIEAETRQFEARQPFLQKQLELYTEATNNASIIATSSDPKALNTARQRFMELYWGELALVENGGLLSNEDSVENAVAKFKQCLDSNCSQDELQQLALKLAHACRDSLAISWNVQDWKAPVYFGQQSTTSE